MAVDIDLSKISKEIGEPTARFVESQDEKRQKQMIYGFAAAFFVLFLGGIGFFWYLNNANTARAAALDSEIAHLTTQNADLLMIEREGNAIQLRNSSALAILSSTPAWSYIFDGLEKITPKGIIFNRFEVEQKDSLKMTGVSPDYETISEFMVVMRNSDLFTNVNLANSSLNRRGDVVNVEFSITFGVSHDITRQAFEDKAEVLDQNIQMKAEQQAPVPTTGNGAQMIETTIDENTGLPVL